MTFETLLNGLLQDTGNSLQLFAPELVLCGTVLLLLFGRLFEFDRWIAPYWIALVGSGIALAFSAVQFAGLDRLETDRIEFFTGLLVYDQFTVFFRLFLTGSLLLVIWLTMLSGIPDREDGPDFYTLLVGSVVGMSLMASANNLLILFLGVEMASVPSFAMVGFLKGRRLSSEAALKFVVYGAGAAGVMLYGISLLGGLLGTLELPELAGRLNVLLEGESAGMSNATVRTVVLAVMMVLVGLAFKLSVVPFHFWCPDAFEGAPAEVAGFLSVASKGAAFALLVRFLLSLVGGEANVIAEVNLSLGIGVGIVAAITATFGNLAAYAQNNMKRLLAYSTIAHAGYMLMAVSALIVILSAPAGTGLEDVPAEAAGALRGLLFYLGVYLFMNLGAFSIVALIRNHIYSEEIDDYGGLWQQTPALCVCMGICLFSLVGLPPFGGFFAKWMIFISLVHAASVHWFMWVVLAVGAANTVFSLFYYMRVLKAMFLQDRPAEARPAVIPLGSAPAGYVSLLSVPIVLLGMVGPAMEWLSRTANYVASVLIP